MALLTSLPFKQKFLLFPQQIPMMLLFLESGFILELTGVYRFCFFKYRKYDNELL